MKSQLALHVQVKAYLRTDEKNSTFTASLRPRRTIRIPPFVFQYNEDSHSNSGSVAGILVESMDI